MFVLTAAAALQVSLGPLYSFRLVWSVRRETDVQTGVQTGVQTVLNVDTTRGGVLINTAMEDGKIVSNLSLARARPEDGGEYTCLLAGALSVLGNTTVTVHILNTTNTEPVHGAASRLNLASSLTLLLSLRDVMRTLQ